MKCNSLFFGFFKNKNQVSSGHAPLGGSYFEVFKMFLVVYAAFF